MIDIRHRGRTLALHSLHFPAPPGSQEFLPAVRSHGIGVGRRARQSPAGEIGIGVTAATWTEVLSSGMGQTDCPLSRNTGQIAPSCPIGKDALLGCGSYRQTCTIIVTDGRREQFTTVCRSCSTRRISNPG